MREVAILGVAMHAWGKFPDKSVLQMSLDTANAALKDAGVDWCDIGGVGAASSHFSGGMGWGLSANELLQAAAMSGVPVFNVSAACAAGGSAFNAAYLMVSSGICDIALAVAGEKMPKGFIPRTPGAADDITDLDYLRWSVIGFPNPGYWAMEATRRMYEYGTKEEHYARVSVKSHKIGSINPYARYRKALTLEEVMNSPMVNYPLRLFEICAVSDGATAVVLAADNVWRKRTTKPVLVAASATATGQYGDPQIRIPEISTTVKPGGQYYSEVVAAVQKAYKMAGIGPKDIDFTELQDNCSWQELSWPELFGLCKPGEADWLVDHDETGINGKMPINTSGGFLSFGEATTAMGLWQLCELVWQLRGQAGARQLNRAKVGLATTLGLGGNGSAIILKV
ncbi:MAG: lipid-transfer protein [Chloroflexi bacterium]|nr:lipid-transfer protein [Chloroflexota bacterium]